MDNDLNDEMLKIKDKVREHNFMIYEGMPQIERMPEAYWEAADMIRFLKLGQDLGVKLMYVQRFEPQASLAESVRLGFVHEGILHIIEINIEAT